MISKNSDIQALLLQMGLRLDKWVSLDVLDEKTEWILDNMTLFDDLPKKIKGDLTNLRSENVLKRRKTICALCRRLARYIEAAVLRKRRQIYINKKTESRYSYRLIKS